MQFPPELFSINVLVKFADAKNNSYHFFFDLSIILLGTIQ